MSKDFNLTQNGVIQQNDLINKPDDNPTAKLKPSKSQAMMNSNLLHSLPKYIFQSEHSGLKSAESLVKKVKEQQTSKDDPTVGAESECEVSEYPIEFYENQQHAIERHMKKKFTLF
jgi:hypothetical protein